MPVAAPCRTRYTHTLRCLSLVRPSVSCPSLCSPTATTPVCLFGRSAAWLVVYSNGTRKRLQVVSCLRTPCTHAMVTRGPRVGGHAVRFRPLYPDPSASASGRAVSPSLPPLPRECQQPGANADKRGYSGEGLKTATDLQSFSGIKI